MSSADSKPTFETRLQRNWYFRSSSAYRLLREMSMRHVLSSSACAAVFIVIGLCVVAVSHTSASGTHDVWSADDGAISPDAMQRIRDVKNLPTLKIVDMTLVFPSE